MIVDRLEFMNTHTSETVVQVNIQYVQIIFN